MEIDGCYCATLNGVLEYFMGETKIISHMNYVEYMKRIFDIYQQYQITVEALDRFGADKDGLRSFIEEQAKSIALKSFTRQWGKDFLDHFDKQYNTLKQNVLIISFAIFESFVKDLLRDILFESLYTMRPGRKHQDKIKKILEPNDRKMILDCLSKFGLDKTIHEQVEDEVKKMSKDFKEWPGYFSNRTGISWPKDKKWERLIELKGLRNDIIHELPDKKVSDKDLDEAFELFLAIATELMGKIVKKYPDIFQFI